MKHSPCSILVLLIRVVFTRYSTVRSTWHSNLCYRLPLSSHHLYSATTFHTLRGSLWTGLSLVWLLLSRSCGAATDAGLGGSTGGSVGVFFHKSQDETQHKHLDLDLMRIIGHKKSRHPRSLKCDLQQQWSCHLTFKCSENHIEWNRLLRYGSADCSCVW